MPKRLAVVVPSNRPAEMRAFLDAWSGQDYPAEWHVVWDSPTFPRNDELAEEFQTNIVEYCHEAIESTDVGIGADSWIIPRKTAAVRSYGILQAFRSGADYIACLDDDVLPAGPDHLRRLVAALETPVQSEWVGIGPQKQRGIPFELPTRPVALHEGGWWGTPDLDAPTQLVEGVSAAYRTDRALGTVAVPTGVWLALSAMHMIFRREMAPAMYQLLMGEGWPYHRFDDIWSGMFAKKVADHLGMAVTYGSPQVEHRRASNVYNSLVAEAPGIREHESRWREIAALPVEGDCATCAYRSIAAGVAGFGGDYWPKLAEAMGIWAGLFPCMGERAPMEQRIEGEIAAEEAIPEYLRIARGFTLHQARCREILPLSRAVTGECTLPIGHQGAHEYRSQLPTFTVHHGNGTSHEAPADAVKEAVG